MEEAAKAYASMVKLMFMGMGALSKAFYEKYGKEALPIITEVASQGGVEYGKVMQQMTPAKGMKAVGELFKMMDSMMGGGDGDNRVVRRRVSLQGVAVPGWHRGNE